jgi:hypothetical protein
MKYASDDIVHVHVTWWYQYSFTGTEYRWLLSFMLRPPYF